MPTTRTFYMRHETGQLTQSASGHGVRASARRALGYPRLGKVLDRGYWPAPLRLKPGLPALSTALRDETVERTEVRVATNVLPRISQNLKRVCKGCGHRHTYDVGRIFFQGLIETDPRKPFLGGLR